MADTYILILGSNKGDRVKLLHQVKRSIENDIGSIHELSSIWESESWGYSDPENYLNQVIKIKSDLAPLALLGKCQAIEKKYGRVRTGNNYQARTMDIDILFFENQVISLPDLVIPHPKIQERRFVLEPLNEIEPDFIHPGLNLTVQKLLAKCSDTGKVEKHIWQ